MFIVKGVLSDEIVYKEFLNNNDDGANHYFNNFVTRIQDGKSKGHIEILDTSRHKIVAAYPWKDLSNA